MLTARKKKICKLISEFQKSNKKWIKIKNINKDETVYSVSLIKYRHEYTTSIEVNSDIYIVAEDIPIDSSKFKIYSNVNTNYICIRQSSLKYNITKDIKEDIHDELMEYLESESIDVQTEREICVLCDNVECVCNI
jgi:hypothetical protein